MKLVFTISSAAAALCIATSARAQERVTAVSKFRIQEIDKTLKVGYGIRLVDLNGDKRPDIVVADSARVIWFENPGRSADGKDAAWKLHTVIENAKTDIKADNVCLDVYDIDGDGKLDIALGADWQPGNTLAGGSLHWLKQGKDTDEPWAVTNIAAPIPTLHRINFADLDGDGKAELLVGPLKGKGSTPQKNFMDVGTPLTAYAIPADPSKDQWEPKVVADALHVMHNFLPVYWDEADFVDSREVAPPRTADVRAKEKLRTQLLTASYEGVTRLWPTSSGPALSKPLGAGYQETPKASRGSSEIRLGKVGGHPAIATIEPFHGTQVVVYTPPASGGGLWPRTLLDDTLKEGHALWMADLDGDGSDEVVAGWRGGKPTGLRVYQALAAAGKPAPPVWEKHDLDLGGVAVEDLACADLDGDGKPEIVAAGRATGNVRVYWNEGR